MAFGQEHLPCTTEPSSATYARMVAQSPAVHAFAQSAAFADAGNEVREVPVYVHVIRKNGVISGWPNGITTADIDVLIQHLNTTFNGTGVHFSRLGVIVNFMDYPDFGTIGWTYERYSYVRTAFNVYLGAHTNSTFQPDDMPIVPGGQNNVTLLGPLGFQINANGYSDFAHETGHHLGLLHTHGATTPYIYPATTAQPDWPYYDNGLARELVIRSTNLVKTFPEPNCEKAGDLCCDTQADCAFNAVAFPNFDPNGLNCLLNPLSCTPGCLGACPISGDYRDYNGDPILGEPFNLMSYHCCGNQVTKDQRSWVIQNYDQYRASLYAQNQPVNLFDFTDFYVKDYVGRMSNVKIEWRHDATPGLFTNSLSNQHGMFQAVLYDPNKTKANVRKMGSAVKATNVVIPGQVGGTLDKEDIYTRSDWEQGVSMCDALAVHRYVLGNGSLNGYQKIAADVTHSGSVTMHDRITIERFLLGYLATFPAYQQPWRFIPEYIPEDYNSEFHDNPFFMLINGVTAVGAPYTEPTWEYAVPLIGTGKGGFDGVHLGDVDDCMIQYCGPFEEGFLGNQLLAPQQTYEIQVKANGFQDIAAYQLGFFVDTTQLEVLGVTAGDLPGFSQESNVGPVVSEENALRLVWLSNNGMAHSLNDGQVLFSVAVAPKVPITNLGQAFHLDDEVLKNGFFGETGCDEVGLQFLVSAPSEQRGAVRNAPVEAKLFCYPNPVNGEMTIYIENPCEENAVLRLFSPDGQLRWQQSLDLISGANVIRVGPETLDKIEPGLFTVSLAGNSGVRHARVSKVK